MPCTDNGAAGRERGAALAIAIFALAVIGGLVAASFPAGLLEQQSGRNTLFITQAMEAAEAGLAQLLRTLPADTLRSLATGGPPLEPQPMAPAVGLRVERKVSRLTDTLFLIQSRGTRVDADGAPLATRTLGVLVQLISDSLGGTVVRARERAWLQLY